MKHLTCKRCRSLVGTDVEILTVGVMQPATCAVCGLTGDETYYVRGDIADEAHRRLAELLRPAVTFPVVPMTREQLLELYPEDDPGEPGKVRMVKP